MSETPCFTVFSEGRPLNFGGEIVTPEIQGVWADRVFLDFFGSGGGEGVSEEAGRGAQVPRGCLQGGGGGGGLMFFFRGRDSHQEVVGV